MNVFVHVNVCAPVETSPRAVPEASGILKVCTEPLETILNHNPLVPIENVCIAPVSPFIDHTFHEKLL